MLVVHHMRKDGDVERGSSSFRGAADTMLLAKRPSKNAPITFSCTKQKDAEEFPDMQFRLKILPEFDSCVVTSTRTAQQMQKTLDILQVLEDGPLSWDALVSRVSGKMSKMTVNRNLVILKESGEIIKKNGKYALA